MSLRRPVALAAGVLLLGAPALTACGFDYPTNRVNTIANGATDREETVWVLNAIVVSARPTSGTVITTLSNKSNREPIRLISVTASNEVRGGDSVPLNVTEQIDVGLLPGAAANLASDPQIRVSGAFDAGEVVTLNFGFDNGEQVVVQAPVLTDCGIYEGLDVAPVLPSREEQAIPLPAYDCGPPVAGPGVEANLEGPAGEAVPEDEVSVED